MSDDGCGMSFWSSGLPRRLLTSDNTYICLCGTTQRVVRRLRNLFHYADDITHIFTYTPAHTYTHARARRADSSVFVFYGFLLSGLAFHIDLIVLRLCSRYKYLHNVVQA